MNQWLIGVRHDIRYYSSEWLWYFADWWSQSIIMKNRMLLEWLETTTRENAKTRASIVFSHSNITISIRTAFEHSYSERVSVVDSHRIGSSSVRWTDSEKQPTKATVRINGHTTIFVCYVYSLWIRRRLMCHSERREERKREYTDMMCLNGCPGILFARAWQFYDRTSKQTQRWIRATHLKRS